MVNLVCSECGAVIKPSDNGFNNFCEIICAACETKFHEKVCGVPDPVVIQAKITEAQYFKELARKAELEREAFLRENEKPEEEEKPPTKIVWG